MGLLDHELDSYFGLLLKSFAVISTLLAYVSYEEVTLVSSDISKLQMMCKIQKVPSQAMREFLSPYLCM